MSTSSRPRQARVQRLGFTALELLIGMALTLLLALAVAPLFVSTQSAGVHEADRTVEVLQGRVAAARLERDLRMATGGGSRFATDGAILEATPKQLVFLGQTGGASALGIIEWELSGSTLMRRWGPCPGVRPVSYSHSLFVDHKSMLEGLSTDAGFTYVVNGCAVTGAVPGGDLVLIEAVTLCGSGRDEKGHWPQGIRVSARVGR